MPETRAGQESPNREGANKMIFNHEISADCFELHDAAGNRHTVLSVYVDAAGNRHTVLSVCVWEPCTTKHGGLLLEAFQRAVFALRCS